MNLPLEKRVLDSLRRNALIRPADHIGVAVSGGSDSVGLLHLLLSLRTQLGINISALHFNHQLRASESDMDEVFVAELAREMEIPLISDREDAGAFARGAHLNLENAGRQLRYAFFDRAICGKGLTQVATAHTLDDQAETVFARLCRGTGMRGLCGIHRTRGNVIRPLLEFRRGEIQAYLCKRGLTWCEDASNHDFGRLRARIRHHLLPIVEASYSRSISAHLAGLAEQAQSEESLWETLLDYHCNLTAGLSNGVCAIDVKAILHGLPPGIQWPSRAQYAFGRRLVRRLVEQVCGAGNFPSAVHVEQVMRLATDRTSGKSLDLPHGLQVVRQFNRLVFSLRRNALTQGISSSSYRQAIGIPEKGFLMVAVPETGERYCLNVFDWLETERETKERLGALDPVRLHSTLILRNCEPGDAYWPVGAGRSKKVIKMLMARRVPAEARRTWPVLTSAGSVVWAFGLPPARDFVGGPGTQTGMTVERLQPRPPHTF